MPITSQTTPTDTKASASRAQARMVAASIITASGGLLPLAAATQRTAVTGTTRLASHEQQRNLQQSRSVTSIMMNSITGGGGSVDGTAGTHSETPDVHMKKLALHYLNSYIPRPTTLRPTLLVSDPLAVPSFAQGRHEGGAAYEQPVGALTRTNRQLAQHSAPPPEDAAAARATGDAARDAIAAAVSVVARTATVNAATSPMRAQQPMGPGPDQHSRSYTVIPPSSQQPKFVSLAEASSHETSPSSHKHLTQRPANTASTAATKKNVPPEETNRRAQQRQQPLNRPLEPSSSAMTVAATSQSTLKPRRDNPRDPSPQPRPWSAPAPTPLEHARAQSKHRTPATAEGPQYRTSKLIAKRLAEESAKAQSASQRNTATREKLSTDSHQRLVVANVVDRLVERGLQEVVLLRPPVPGAAWRRPITLESMAGLRDGAILAHLCNLIVASQDRRSPLKRPPTEVTGDGDASDVPRPRIVVTSSPRLTCSSVVQYLRERLPSAIPTRVLAELPLPAPTIDSLRPDAMVDGKQNDDLLNLVLYLLDILDVLDALEAAQRSNNVPASALRSARSEASSVKNLTTEPLSASCGRRYTAEHMMQLDAAACQFLLELQILPEPHDALRRQVHHKGPPTALEAPYMPLRHQLPKRTTPISAITEPFVFPFLCNGTALCDAVVTAFNLAPMTVRRNPKTASDCLKNIEAAMIAVRRHPRHPPPIFLEEPQRVFEGDREYILMLLEDIMRCTYDVAPRDGPPTPSQKPFLPSFKNYASPPPPVAPAAQLRARSTSPQSSDASSSRAPSLRSWSAAPAVVTVSQPPSGTKNPSSPTTRRSGGVMLSSPLLAQSTIAAAGNVGFGVTAATMAAFGTSVASHMVSLTGAARVLTDAFDAVTPPREAPPGPSLVPPPKPTPQHQSTATASGMVAGFYSDEKDAADTASSVGGGSSSAAAMGRPPLKPPTAASVDSSSKAISLSRERRTPTPQSKTVSVTPVASTPPNRRGASLTTSDSLSPPRNDDSHNHHRLHAAPRPERIAPGALDHLPYLASVVLDPSENYALRKWVLEKLGNHFRHEPQYDPAAFFRESADERGNMKWMDPSLACYLLDDGVVLARLVETLAYAKAGDIAVIDPKPRSVAARRQNLSRVLRYLAKEKKILFDAPFLEEALEAGDIRAVVLTLRAVKAAFPLHGVSLKGPHHAAGGSPPKPTPGPGAVATAAPAGGFRFRLDPAKWSKLNQQQQQHVDPLLDSAPSPPSPLERTTAGTTTLAELAGLSPPDGC